MTFRHLFVLLIAPLVIAALNTAGLAPAAWAEGLARPAGEVILTIDGKISLQNADGKAEFDLDMLRAMPARTFQTGTPWTDGVAEFEGVPLEDLFKAVGATGKTVKATALNDYIADVDVETVTSAGAILAYRMNGADISVRDKGPLWIMFPFDQNPKLKSEVIYSQSVWQLRKISFED